jgi:decaprenyl-phosphate phosphoribosyltransferase
LPSKRVSERAALTIMVVLLVASVALATFGRLPTQFLAILLIYATINLTYSVGLKQVSLIELFLVSSGFLLRLLAGGFAVAIELSPWIIVTTGVIALLLTVGKRRGDIARDNDAQMKRRSLVGYNLAYLDALLAALTGTTLVVYVLFCVSDYATERYGPNVLITAIPVAIGLMRYLQLLIVYGDGDAPTDLLLNDKGLISTVMVFMAIFGGLIYAR